MAILARASCTLSTVRDVASTTRYYKLQSSTASKPAKPTTNPPSGWTTTEPSYTEGSTNSLYFTDLTVFTDGDFAYSDVSLSSSYEAAKQAYNKAVSAGTAAEAAQKKLYHTARGKSGAAGYVAFAKIIIRRIYANASIKLTLQNRGQEATDVVLLFLNANNNDPGLDYIRSTKGVRVYAYKEDTSIWRLIFKKSEAYDAVYVTNYQNPYVECYPTNPYFAWEWTDDFLTGLPDGAIEASNFSAVAAAISTANNAMTAANGKNKVFHQATAPATSAGLTAGDIWFDTSNDYKMSRWTGSAWTEEQFGESAIADASIGNAKIKDASIEHAKIKSLDMGKATVGKLKAEFIDVDNLTALSANIGGFEIKRLERIVSPTYITDSLGVWTYDPYTCMYAIEDSGEWFLCSMPVSGLSDPANFVLEISYSIIPFNTGSVTVFGISGSMRTQIGTVTLDNTPPYYLDSVYTKRYIRIIEASVSAYESVEIRVATDGEYTPESTIHLMGIEGILISIYSQNDSGSVLSRNTTGLSTRENLNLPGARFGTDGISHISVDGTYIAIYDGGIDIGYPITDEDGATYIEKTGGLAAKTSKGETGGLMGKDPAYPLVSWDGSAHLADVTATNVQANGNVEATNLLKHHGGFTVPQIQKGTTALVTAPASGYIDIPVTFNKEFAGNPTILCGLQGNAANGKYGYLSCSPVRSTISTTGVTLRVYNADSSAHNTYVSWAAIY